VKPRLVPRRCDRRTACLSPQLPFRGHIEIDTLDLVSSGRNHVDQQLLHVIEISALNGKRRLTFIAKELALGPETPRTLQPQPGSFHRPVGDAVPAQHFPHPMHRVAGVGERL
jgi:hypothetical protein